jgi:cold shock CspA family protein
MAIFDKYFKEPMIEKQKENVVTESVSKELVEDKLYSGKIITVNSRKGYGFITSLDIPFTRIFFHWTTLSQDTKNFKELTPGMKVEFNAVKAVGKDGKEMGIKAIRIRVIE